MCTNDLSQTGVARNRANHVIDLMFSHHSHSGQFCKHAHGTLEEVVKEAIRKGFNLYGLTEHVPRYRTDDLYPEEVCCS